MTEVIVVDGRIDLERARRDAKALLRRARAGDVVLRDDRPPMLADAQRAVARSLGSASWPALVRDHDLVAAARAGRADEVYRLLVAGASPAAGRAALEDAASLGLPDVVGVLIGWVPIDRSGVASEDPVIGRMLAPQEVAEDRALAEVMRAADAAWFELVAGVAERRVAGDGFAFRTGLFDNALNGVVCSDVDDVGEVLGWLGGAPGQWLVGAGSGLGPRLERAGCRPERSAVFMAAEFELAAGGGVAAPGGIRAVTDAASLRAALAATDELEPHEDEAALLAALGFSGRLRHFAAWREDAPIGLISSFKAPGALMITNMAVAPGWRRRGIGRELVRHVADGLTLLGPTPASVPFYERLGFRLYRCLPDRTFYTPV